MCDYCNLVAYKSHDIKESQTDFGKSLSHIAERKNTGKYELWTAFYEDDDLTEISECTIAIIDYCPWCGRRLAEDK